MNPESLPITTKKMVLWESAVSLICPLQIRRCLLQYQTDSCIGSADTIVNCTWTHHWESELIAKQVRTPEGAVTSDYNQSVYAGLPEILNRPLPDLLSLNSGTWKI